MAQPLSPNEIRDRALKFAREWEGVTNERAEAQSFWNDFFDVFGISRRRVATFEEFVKPIRKKWEEGDLFAKPGKPAGSGFIDLLWKGMLIAEHKSLGKDLDSAYVQALDYLPSLPERDLPRYVVVSDFARIRLYDLETREHNDFALKDLHKNIGLFGFISGYTTQRIQEQDPVNVKAAEKMGRLHDQLKEGGFTGHKLEVLLVRLLFCLFAEDTTIFTKPDMQTDMFKDWIENCTRIDGSDLGIQLNGLFDVLNTPETQRQKNLDERLAAFPYVNGKLFEEALPPAAFNSKMRDALLDCCFLNWRRISPAIFGALFQSVMDEDARRNLGAHYTSEKNILKVVKSLFLDDLRTEFEKAKNNRNKLFEFLKKIASLHFLDPACGCGNFLVIAYRELRLLELDVLKAIETYTKAGHLDFDIKDLVAVNVDQFYGIEIEEFPAQIAQVALWLVDHQMNMRVTESFSKYYRRLPLIHSATIRRTNALQIDWNDVIPSDQVNYILGNPPFVGKQHQDEDQKKDMEEIFAGVRGAGVLDFVAAWYVKAVQYIKGDGEIEDLLSGLSAAKKPRDIIKAAFVSTNSITQGEQVAVLWGLLLGQGIKIHFAHRTFQWTNEAPGMAGVHCVIVGFALFDSEHKSLFDYPDIKGDPHEARVTNINPYLVDAADVVIESRRQPICPVPEIVFGSMPNDGGNLLLEDNDKDALLKSEPAAKKWVRPFLGADEFINGETRWCLWLEGISPQELRSLPEVEKRVAAVKQHRLSSNRAATQELAQYPTLFGEIRQPKGRYIVIPRHSSERREYIPFGFLEPKIICGDSNLCIPDADLYVFGVLTSKMHMAWVKYVCGRLESRYRYTNQVVYNNYPWPSDASEKQKATIEKAAKAILDARLAFEDSSLADLYDPLAMPPELRRAHSGLDSAVDAVYGKKNLNSDADRVAYLFDLYQKFTTLLPAAEKPKRGKRKSH